MPLALMLARSPAIGAAAGAGLLYYFFPTPVQRKELAASVSAQLIAELRALASTEAQTASATAQVVAEIRALGVEQRKGRLLLGQILERLPQRSRSQSSAGAALPPQGPPPSAAPPTASAAPTTSSSAHSVS